MLVSTPTGRALDPAETLELFRLWRENGEDRRAEIIEGNAPLVVYLMRRFRRPDDPDREDLFNDGMVALIEAVDMFDLDRGFQFSTLAGRRIKQALHACRRRSRPLGVGLDDWGEVEQVEASGGSRDDQLRSWEAEQLLAKLAPLDAGILVLRFGLRGLQPMTFDAIGRKLARSDAWVHTRVNAILSGVRPASQAGSTPGSERRATDLASI